MGPGQLIMNRREYGDCHVIGASLSSHDTAMNESGGGGGQSEV